VEGPALQAANIKKTPAAKLPKSAKQGTKGILLALHNAVNIFSSANAALSLGSFVPKVHLRPPLQGETRVEYTLDEKKAMGLPEKQRFHFIYAFTTLVEARFIRLQRTPLGRIRYSV
jgi:hypothetical protein